MSRYYEGWGKRRTMGEGARLRFWRKWERRRSGIKANGSAHEYRYFHPQLIHKGRKP